MAPAEACLQVEVVYCAAPGQTDLVQLLLPPGALLADALTASGLLQRHSLVAAGLQVGVWGRVLDQSSALRDRDRVEIYRPLLVDPKEARRLRYRNQRHKAAGP